MLVHRCSMENLLSRPISEERLGGHPDWISVHLPLATADQIQNLREV
jgi:hypothetical protein